MIVLKATQDKVLGALQAVAGIVERRLRTARANREIWSARITRGATA